MTSPHLKHTPGPWPYRMVPVDETGGETYAWIGPGHISGDGSADNPDRYLLVSGCIEEPDARLIAAAPDLLAALCEYMIMGVGKCTIGKATADKALAAINKATGRA